MDGDFTTLIGKKTCEEMNLITVNYDNFESVTKIVDNSSVLSDYVLSDFTRVFGKDQGGLPGIAHFQVDENVVRVISSFCCIPHAQKTEVKA